MADGRVIEIEPALSHVAKQLDEIELPRIEGMSNKLKLRYSEAGDIFVVYQEQRRSVDGALVMKQIVTTWDCATAGPADTALVERVRKVVHPSYDAGAEAERLDRAADAASWKRFEQEVGLFAEPLQHALKKDLGLTGGRAFVPRDIKRA